MALICMSQPQMDCYIHEKEWNSVIAKITKMPCNNSIWSIIIRLCLGATVYFLWQERNLRIFKDETREWQTVYKIICDNVKARIMGFQVKQSSAMMKAASIWNVQMNIKGT